MGGHVGAPHPQLATFTTRTAWPVPPAESRTLIVTEWLPFGVPLVVQGIDTGPFEVVLVGVPTAVPSTLIVKVLLPAAAFSIQIVNHVVPLTVAPSAPGWVMNTLIVGGGCTVTLRVAVAVRPPPSCTVSVSVWAPGATPEVSQLNKAVGYR